MAVAAMAAAVVVVMTVSAVVQAAAVLVVAMVRWCYGAMAPAMAVTVMVTAVIVAVTLAAMAAIAVVTTTMAAWGGLGQPRGGAGRGGPHRWRVVVYQGPHRGRRRSRGRVM